MHAVQRKEMVLQLFAAVSDVNDYSMSITYVPHCQFPGVMCTTVHHVNGFKRMVRVALEKTADQTVHAKSSDSYKIISQTK